MASGRVNLAVIAGSAATLAASWAGIVAADASEAEAEPAQAVPGVAIGGSSSIILSPLPVAPIAPLQIPDAPSTDLANLTRIEAKPIAAPQITLPSTAKLVPAPAPSGKTTVRKSKAS